MPLEEARELASLLSVGSVQTWRGSSPEPNYAGALILEFQFPELQEMNVSYLNHPSVW